MCPADSVRVVRVEELIPGFEPENDLERRVTEDPELLAGLAWGKPRKAHPEGRIAAHVADLLARIDAEGFAGEERARLRFIAIVHDAFKNKVQEWRPRKGENHHAMRARRFAERYTDSEVLLTTIELHDRPYGIWRGMRRTGVFDRRGLTRLMERLPDPDLFLHFVELDGATEGKKAEPVRWFKQQLREWQEAA
ncbi:MAG TPA: hypothetical protein VGF74_04090 [Thermoleophilaceae bacterium]